MFSEVNDPNLELPDVHAKIAASEPTEHVFGASALHAIAIGKAHRFHAFAVEFD